MSLLFLLSGAASLIYETIWIRVLSLGVGSTTRAMSVVLALFFLGLSAGSYFAGRLNSRLSPLRLYGWIEGSLGLYGTLIVFPLLSFPQLLSWLPQQGALAGFSQVFKFALVGILLSPATLAMGATLPILVKAVPSLRGGTRDGVSHWYAINTFGAVVGSWAAGFILLPRLGLVGSNLVAVLLNTIVAVVAWFSPHLGTKTEADTRPADRSALTGTAPWLITLTAICGFSSLIAEVVWNKYLGIYLGNNVYGLGLVLSTYLLGLAAGSWWCRSLLAKTRHPGLWIFGLVTAAALTLSLSTALFNVLPVVTQLLGFALGSGAAKTIPLMGIKCLLATVALLPATVCFGALFPLVVKMLAPTEGEASRAVSLAYTANTIGAILGSYLAGVFLIPELGSSVALQIASLTLVAGAALAWARIEHRPLKWTAALIPLVALVLAIRFDFRNIVKTAYTQRMDAGTTLTQALRPFAPGYEEFVWIKEGETSLITLSRDPKDGDNYRQYLRLKTNGLNESIYNTKDLGTLPRYEALLGILPYAFSDHPKRAFVVGYGGGFTVDLLTHLPLAKVRVVELEKAILQAADRAYDGKNPIVNRKNLDLSVEDARYVLVTKAGAPWDIIVSQPSQSWLAGAANLFTKEFFQVVLGNLSEKGVYSQWLNLYNMDTATLKSILKTFYGVFPEGAIFSGEDDQEMILIGARQPLKLNLAELGRLTRIERFASKLSAVPFRTPTDLLSHYVMDRKAALAAAGGAPWNTDRNAYAETRQSRLFYEGVPPSEMPQSFLTANYDVTLGGLTAQIPDGEYSVLTSLTESHQSQKFLKLLEAYSATPETPDGKRLSRLGYLYLRAERYESARKALEAAVRTDTSPSTVNLLISAYTELDRPKDVLSTIARYRKSADKITDCYEGAARLRLGQKPDELFRRLTSDVTAYTTACGAFYNKTVGDYFYRQKRYATAVPFYQAYKGFFGTDVAVNRRLASSLLELGRWSEAEDAAASTREAAEKAREQAASMAAYYEQRKWMEDAEVLKRRAAIPAE